MSVNEIRQKALNLPEDKRAELAGELLNSLPAILVDEDDGVYEALRRSKELDDDPSAGCSWDEIKSNLGR